jgi:hypothetical protein
MAVLQLFVLMLIIPLILLFMFIFPQQFYASLLFLYEPQTRLLLIFSITLFFLWRYLTRKHKEHTYDYFDDLSLTERRVDGEFYHYSNAIDPKDKGANFTLFIDGKCGYDFMLKYENKFEKLLKSLHLSYECQSGNKKFDDTIYILSDDKILCKDLQEDTELQTLIFKLFWNLKEHDFTLKYLRYYDGRLILHARTKESSEQTLSEIERLCDMAAPLMRQIITHLPDKVQQDQRVFREKSSRVISIILIIFTALLANGVLKLILESFSIFYLPRLVERYSFLLPSLEITAIFTIAYIIFILFYFYKSSRLALALFFGITLVASAVFLTSITALKEIDVYLDKSKPTIELHHVTETRAVTGRRNSYYLTFDKLDEMRVPYGFYKKFHTNDFAYIYVKKGFLDVPWIYSIKRLQHSR